MNAQPAIPTPWLTPEQAAAYLCLSKLTLTDWRCNGTWPVYHKAGSLVRYHIADLDAWMVSSAKEVR